MGRPSRVRVRGPLARYASGFEQQLADLGYTPSSAEDQLRLLAHLSGWLAERELTAEAMTPVVVEQFLDGRRAAGRKGTVRAVQPLLGYLHGLGVLPDVIAGGVATPVERLLADYREYLLRVRGLAVGTVRLHERVAEMFLAELGDPGMLELLTAGQVTGFVLRECRAARRGTASAKTLISCLRSLLRFLYWAGWVPVGLDSAVPAVAGWRLSGLPRGLPPGQVQALLASCDRATALGRRDFAVLVLLARLGLRSREVADLTLEDVDWRAGELMIRGKGSRMDRLPLPHEVGCALADYLRHGRPRCSCRGVFLRDRAPRVAISADGVRSVVHHACDRAGLDRVGAHRLRHGVACDLLAAGAPLAEIAQILRHADLATTAIYAKADRGALAGLARPWPGGGAA